MGTTPFTLSNLLFIVEMRMYLRDQTGTSWIDVTSSGNNGVYVGGLLTTTRFGGGYTTPANQITRYILLPENALQNLSNGNLWTINIWMEVLSHSGARYFTSMASGSNDNMFIMQINNDSTFHPWSSVLQSGSHATWSANVPMMVTICRIDASTYRIYKDGLFTGAYTRAASNETKTVTGWVLDQEQDSVKGAFDSAQNTHANWYEMSLINRNLTDTEVNAEFQRTKGRYNIGDHATGLVFYLRNQTGLNWYDIVGSGANGVYVGDLMTTSQYGGGYTTPENQVSRYILLPEQALQNLPSGFAWTVNVWMEVLSHSGLRYFCSMASSSIDNAFIMELTDTQLYPYNSTLQSGSHASWDLNVPMMVTINRVNATTWKTYKNGTLAGIYSSADIDTKTVLGWVLDQEQDSVKGTFNSSQNTHANWYEVALFGLSLSDAEVSREFDLRRRRFYV